MPRPASEAATPMPAFAPVLREWEFEGAGVGVVDAEVMDAEGEGVVVGGVEDAEDGEDVEDGEDAEDGEDVEDEVVLLAGRVAEVDGPELDVACLVKDCGGGA